MATDKLGLEFTAALPETVGAFNNAMDDYMLFTGEPVGKLLATVQLDCEQPTSVEMEAIEPP